MSIYDKYTVPRSELPDFIVDTPEAQYGIPRVFISRAAAENFCGDHHKPEWHKHIKELENQGFQFEAADGSAWVAGQGGTFEDDHGGLPFGLEISNSAS